MVETWTELTFLMLNLIGRLPFELRKDLDLNGVDRLIGQIMIRSIMKDSICNEEMSVIAQAILSETTPLSLPERKRLLEVELYRLNASDFIVVLEHDASGTEAVELAGIDQTWITNQLCVGETLMAWKQLPANAGGFNC